jgi:hypothetical protein
MMAPEIHDDEFYYNIVDLMHLVRPKSVIEIGSGSGLGSTQAFIEGMKGNPDCLMVCMEIDMDRFVDLVKITCGVDGVICLREKFVDESMSEEEIRRFLEEHPTMNPAQHGVDTVLGWKAGQDDMLSKVKPCTLIGPESRFIDSPLVALIDGSPFSGLAEAKKLVKLGADYILLDDVNDIKCHDACGYLESVGYRCTKRNDTLRNGYAIYKKGE